MISVIYSIRKDNLRRPLWDRLLHFSGKDIPWRTMGYFNLITTNEENQVVSPIL